MNEKENILSDTEVKDLQKKMADREARTADKVNKLLSKGRDLTASDIKWLLGKEVRRKRIAKAMRMSISTFERYLSEHGLITKKVSNPVDMDKVKELVETTNLTPKEISDQTGASYSAAYYYYKQKEKGREDVTEKIKPERTAAGLEEQIQQLKDKLERYGDALETSTKARQELAGKLQEEQSKVKEREKMLDQLNKDVQRLIQERDSMNVENLRKQHDLLLEYIRLGV
ncbi:hypothetical protein [Oceanobacillus sojae]|uniref:hypothetical protein n=1 Tax=Oceanobacillus sojae TaxID=582851 RepID=UPI0021A2F799|nr:hypothetical protein [Oceanobacillus sojae]MCT1904096.1 hypothetical protein [Oceanobacillus sojae]